MSEAHGKELNVLTSYRLNDFKKKAGATHVDMSANIRRAAFTLAEVLITLAIIGVVAAMTIPTLVVNYQKKATATKVRKAYSELAQALKMAQAEHGDPNTWQVIKYSDSAENSEWFVDTYLRPYLKIARDCGTGNEAKTNCHMSSAGVYSYNFILSDGVGISVAAYSYGESVQFTLTVNFKDIRVGGVDDFGFLMLLEDMSKGLLPYGYTEGVTREEIKSGYLVNYPDKTHQTDSINIACKPYDGEDYDEDSGTYIRHSCTYLLWVDNWEFKDDYPW